MSAVRRPSTCFARVLPFVAVVALGATSLTMACTSNPSIEPGSVAADGGTDAVVEAGPTAPSACVAPTGAGVEHKGDITADEVWKASDSPHRVTSALSIHATVTLEACATVVVSKDVSIEVGDESKAGKIVAAGEFVPAEGTRPSSLRLVTFSASTTGEPWGALIVGAKGSADFSATAIIEGDSPASRVNASGALRVFGASSTSVSGAPTLTKSVRAKSLFVTNAGEVGINLLRYAGFTDDSTGVTVQATKGPTPLRVEFGAVGTLPRDLVLVENARDVVLVDQTWNGTLSTTFKAIGAPYMFEKPIYLQPVVVGAPAVMTIEAGATLQFGGPDAQAVGIIVGNASDRQGQIVAQGTAAKPIRFTSASAAPAAGDWMGLYFRYYPVAGNVIENAVIEYAGAPNQTNGFGGPRDNAASVVMIGARPSEAFIRQSKLRFGGGETGIVSGWTSDLDGPDFKAPNTFESMPACAVSKWRPMTGTCNGSSSDPVCL